MDFSNERYVRVYTRDSTSWKRLGWQGQAVFMLLLRRVDRTGVIEIEDIGVGEALSLHTGVPLDVAEAAAGMLLKLGIIETAGTTLVIPRFIEAQEASMNAAARQQEHRLRRRDQIRKGLDPSQRATAIYFIQSENGGEIKIGQTDDVAKRLGNLSTGRPDKLVLLAAAPGTPTQERQLHQKFAASRVRGEWFLPTQDLMEFILEVTRSGSKALEALSQDVTCHNLFGVTAAQKTFGVTPSVPSVPCLADPDPKQEEEEEEEEERARAAAPTEPVVIHFRNPTQEPPEGFEEEYGPSDAELRRIAWESFRDGVVAVFLAPPGKPTDKQLDEWVDQLDRTAGTDQFTFQSLCLTAAYNWASERRARSATVPPIKWMIERSTANYLFCDCSKNPDRFRPVPKHVFDIAVGAAE